MAEQSLLAQLQPSPRESGFRQDGYFVWCGSAVKGPDGQYHLFASRWPEATGFPDGYRTHSEIVHAVAGQPLGPYSYKEVILARRAAGSWDSTMVHNPAIYLHGGRALLYYIGSGDGPVRRIGLATAPSLGGPWTRPERPLDLGADVDANNPAAVFEDDQSVKLVWRTRDLRACISTAPSPEGPYRLANENVWPAGKIEDFYFFRHGGRYHLICEDNVGSITGHARWGAHLVSDNGIDGWRPAAEAAVYDHSIRWLDGGEFHAVRRERPWLLFEPGGAICLFNGVYDGARTWNQPVPIAPPWLPECR